MTKTYWMIAAGAHGRDYADYFLKHKLAFWGRDEDKPLDIKSGDIMVLRKGRNTIIATGEVIADKSGKSIGYGDKEWLNDFDGWVLKAYCYVDWKEPKQPLIIPNQRYGTIYRINQQNQQKLISSVDNILLNGFSKTKSMKEPLQTKTVTDEELLDQLIGEGLSPTNADELTEAISRIRLLARYYYRSPRWEDVREHETRTFLVIPLLLSMGWSEQQLKIELPFKEKGYSRGRVDIACFQNNYKGNNNECVAIIETKGFSSGLDYASVQANSYAANFQNSKALIVTNGYCYKIFMRDDKSIFQQIPTAYINLLNPRDRYPLDPKKVGGALEAIKWLLPSNLI